MADFITAFNRTMEHEASGKTYDASKSDKGNYWNGQLIGTKFGITGTFYFEVTRKAPTASIIKSLTLSDAANMANAFIWQRMKVGRIQDQSIANAVFDYCFNRYGEAIRVITGDVMQRQSDIKASLNTLKFTDGTIDDINQSDPFAFIELLKSARLTKATANYKGDTLRVIKMRIDSFAISPTSPVLCNIGRVGKVVTTQTLCEGPAAQSGGVGLLIGAAILLLMLKMK